MRVSSLALLIVFNQEMYIVSELFDLMHFIEPVFGCPYNDNEQNGNALFL